MLLLKFTMSGAFLMSLSRLFPSFREWSVAIQMKATEQYVSVILMFFLNAVQSGSNFWVWKWNLRVFLKSVIPHIFPSFYFLELS